MAYIVMADELWFRTVLALPNASSTAEVLTTLSLIEADASCVSATSGVSGREADGRGILER